MIFAGCLSGRTTKADTRHGPCAKHCTAVGGLGSSAQSPSEEARCKSQSGNRSAPLAPTSTCRVRDKHRRAELSANKHKAECCVLRVKDGARGLGEVKVQSWSQNPHPLKSSHRKAKVPSAPAKRQCPQPADRCSPQKANHLLYGSFLPLKT